MTKTMSIRMDRDNYEFLTKIVKEDRSDFDPGRAGSGDARQSFATAHSYKKARLL
jgi:hypothetical protein